MSVQLLILFFYLPYLFTSVPKLLVLILIRDVKMALAFWRLPFAIFFFQFPILFPIYQNARSTRCDIFQARYLIPENAAGKVHKCVGSLAGGREQFPHPREFSNVWRLAAVGY